MKKLVLLPVIIFFGVYFLNGQSLDRFVIASTGAFGTNPANQIEYTVGEMAVTTISNGTIILNQGFQQSNPPYNTSLESQLVAINYLLYPNPTNGKTVLELESAGKIEIRLELWDMQGKKLPLLEERHSFSGNKVIELDLSSFSTGMYILKFSDLEGQILESLRLQKL